MTRIVDLSFVIKPHFRWKAVGQHTATHAAGDPLQSTVMTISCHAFTHVDAPLHYLPDGRDIASMPVDQWIGEAAVVDLTHLGADGEVSAAELEKHAGHVRAGDIVLLWTDWPRKMDVETREFWTTGPFTGPSGCEWLIRKGVKAVGYDYPPDFCTRHVLAGWPRRPSREEHTTHAMFFPAGITVIEYLTNLHAIGAPRCRFLALPLRIDGADGSPVRAVAYVE